MKKLVLGACAAFLLVGIAFAGDANQAAPTAAATADPMAAMMAEMAKCDVCSHMTSHMATLGPVMKMEVVHLNDGIAMVHKITDPSKMDEFRKVDAEMNAAGTACLALSDADAKTHLCAHCQEIRANVKAGATMSQGQTKDGCMMILTSSDPAIQKNLADFGTKCAMMMEHM